MSKAIQRPNKWPSTRLRLGAGYSRNLELGTKFQELASCETVAAAVEVLRAHLPPHEAQSLDELLRQDGLVVAIRQNGVSKVLTRHSIVRGGLLALDGTPQVDFEFSAAMKGG
jgi:hypothetical protein